MGNYNLADTQILYGEREITIAANSVSKEAIFGEQFEILSNTASTIKVSIDGQPETELSSNVGIMLPGASPVATQVDFINDTASDITLRYAFGINFRNNRLGISGAEPLNTKSGNTISVASHTVGLAAAQLKVADSDRTRLTIINNGTDTIYFGVDNAITTALNSAPIPIGGSFTIESGDEVWAISGTAGQDVRTVSEGI